MIVEYIRYALSKNSAAELEAAYARAGEHLKASPECHGFELSRCSEQASNLVVRILWTSSDAHLKGFRTGPRFPSFLAEIRPFVSEIVEMRHYDFTPVAWAR
jgi:heme-degrading monooxygenase HmoA